MKVAFIIKHSSSNTAIGVIDEDLEYNEYEGNTKDERFQIKKIKVALYNNLAACYLKLNDFSNTRAACDEALSLDSNQPKAL